MNTLGNYNAFCGCVFRVSVNFNLCLLNARKYNPAEDQSKEPAALLPVTAVSSYILVTEDIAMTICQRSRTGLAQTKWYLMLNRARLVTSRELTFHWGTQCCDDDHDTYCLFLIFKKWKN